MATPIRIATETLRSNAVNGTVSAGSVYERISAVCERRFLVLASLVLALAAFNLGFRIHLEALTEWDESLYATSAWEMLQSGNWVATTFGGTLDYYNSKPPLNVWLIALSMRLFGVSLFAIRLPAILAAWATVAVTLSWGRRQFGPAVALLSGVVLSTCFGFVHIHSGRTANTDALFALLVLLTVVTVSAEERLPRGYLWLGPILAAAFMLRGLGAVMPLLIVVGAAVFPPRPLRMTWGPALAIVALFLVPVGAWALARYRVDGWRFYQQMLWYDFVARTLSKLEHHRGGPLAYVNLLLKHHYDWVLAAVTALIVQQPAARPSPPQAVRGEPSRLRAVLVAWAIVTVGLPTVMATRMPWYLNPFYPLFALAVAWLVMGSLRAPGSARSHRLLLVAVAAALLSANAFRK